MVGPSVATAKKPVKTLGAGPLLPVHWGIVGILKKIAATPRPSLVNILTKMNLRKARGGIASTVGCDGQPLELLLPKEQLDQDDVDVDVDSNRDATRGRAFESDIDGSIDDEEGNSVSCCPAAPFD